MMCEVQLARRLGRFTARARFLGWAILAAGVVIGRGVWAQGVALQWDSSTDAEVVSYNVYYGTGHTNYTVMFPVGNITSTTVTNLTPGVTYYFAATAVNGVGLESDYSNEASYTIPASGTNLPPTLVLAGNVTVPENAGAQSVQLSGITPGNTNAATLIVTAASSNPSCVPTPAVSYVYPSTSGVLSFTPVSNASGTATITVTVDNGVPPNNVTTQSFQVTVMPELIVTPANQSRVYGAVNPALTGSVSQNGDNITATFLTAASVATPVGAYPITAVLNDPNGRLGNYYVVSNTGTLTITPAPLSVGAVNVSRAYGAPNPTLSGSLNGVQAGDNITAVYTTAALPTSPLGVYSIVPALNDPSGRLANYSVASQSGTLTVTAAPLTIQANSQSRLYGQPNPALTMAYSGFMNGDTASVLMSTAVGACSAQTNSPVGAYPILVSGASALNYAIQYVAGTLSVEPAPLVVAVQDCSRAYGLANPPFAAEFSGFVNGDGSNVLGGELVFATAAQTNSPPGSYPIQASGLVSTNYSLEYSNGTITVTAAAYPLSVQADNQTRVYGSVNPVLTGRLVGVQTGDNITANYTTVAVPGSPAGTYSIVPVLNDPAGRLANYNVTIQNGFLTVAPAPLIIQANPQTRFYGQANPAFTVGWSGFVNGDTAAVLTGTLVASCAAQTNSPVGAYPICVSGQSAANYAIQYVDGSLMVQSTPLVVWVQNASRAYGQANPAFGVNFSGFVNGDGSNVLGGELVFATPAQTNSPVGAYPIEASGLVSTNYSLEYSNATLTVTTYALSVQADNQTRVYGSANPSLTGVLTGVQPGDNITASYTTMAVPSSAVGTYGIVPTINDPAGRLGNYTVTTQDGTLTVAPASLTIQADAQTRLYGQTNPPITASYIGFANGDTAAVLTGNLGGSCAAQTKSPVGGYPICVSGQSGSNYTIQYLDGVLTVQPAPLAIQVQDASRPYGQANPAFSATYLGFVNGEDPSVLGGQLAFATTAQATSAAGTYPIDASGLISTNYALSYSSGTLTVTSAPPATVCLSVSGLQPGAGFSLTVSGAAGQAYILQASDDLLHWTSLGTNQTDSTGQFQFQDPQAATNVMRFYRTAIP